jgi:hypothetical protein
MKERRYSLVYELAVANVRRFDRRAIDTREAKKENSFPRTLKRGLVAEHERDITEAEREQHEELMQWCWTNNWRPSFVPDLWYVDPGNRDIHIFEIEDTSPLTSEKLTRLVDFWWSMDNEGWDVKVVVFDRYGLQPRIINVQRAAFREMGADTNSAGYRAAIEFLRLDPDDDDAQA